MSGFQNASVTKGMMILLGVSSLTVSLLDIKPYFHLQLVPHMTKYHQFWRLLVHPFVFTNSTELLIGELLLYNVGVHIERSFGPRKYASFILLSSILSTILSFAAIVLFHAFGLPSIPAGPYGVIFSLLWQHHRVVPSLYSFRVLGTEYSNKVFQWILALQLFTSSPPTSILASLSGLAAGYLYRTDTLLLPSSLRHRRILKPLKSFRIPISIYNLLQRLFHPLIRTSPPPRRNLRALPGQINEATALRAQRMATASQLAGPTFSSLLAARMNPGAAANPSVTRRNPAAGLAANRVPGAAATPRPAPPAETTRPAAATGARAAMGEWVSEMTGGNGVRAPTEQEIIALTSIFPNLSRERIISALQRSNYNTALAVEALIQEAS